MIEKLKNRIETDRLGYPITSIPPTIEEIMDKINEIIDVLNSLKQ